jgi:hypothetical protein
MLDWPTVDLSGKEFVIPRVCPNCMAPAEHAWRTDYTKPRFGGQTRLTMTFYYCGECDRMLRTKQAIEKKQLSYGPRLLALWIGVFMIFLFGMGTVIGNEMNEGWLLLPLALAVAVGVHFTRRMGAKRRALMDEGLPPLPPNAIGYGFAAFLIDGTGGVFGQKTSTFSAARLEWLDLLVQANADSQV